MPKPDKLSVDDALRIAADGPNQEDPYPVPDWLRAYMEHHQPTLATTRGSDVATFWRHVHPGHITQFVRSAESQVLELDARAAAFVNDLRSHCEYWVSVFEAKLGRMVQRATSERQKDGLLEDPSYQHYDAALATLRLVVAEFPSELAAGEVFHDIVEAIRSKSSKKRKLAEAQKEETRAPIDGSDACLMIHVLAKIAMRPLPDTTLDKVAAILTGYSHHTAREARANLAVTVGLREAKSLFEDLLRGIEAQIAKKSPKPIANKSIQKSENKMSD